MVSVPQVREFSPAALLSLKLLALSWMVGDHLDWFLFGGALGIHSGLGRLVFPIFGLVLAMNLLLVSDSNALLQRIAPRMAFVGLAACVPYVYLAGWWPLNVLSTLAAATVAIACMQRGWYLVAGAVIVSSGLLVDYLWFGVLYVVLAWLMLRRGYAAEAVLVMGAVLLYPINGNLWALLAVPVVHAARYLPGNAPRCKWAFYALYPGHLLALAIIKAIA